MIIKKKASIGLRLSTVCSTTQWVPMDTCIAMYILSTTLNVKTNVFFLYFSCLHQLKASVPSLPRKALDLDELWNNKTFECLNLLFLAGSVTHLHRTSLSADASVTNLNTNTLYTPVLMSDLLCKTGARSNSAPPPQKKWKTKCISNSSNGAWKMELLLWLPFFPLSLQ